MHSPVSAVPDPVNIRCVWAESQSGRKNGSPKRRGEWGSDPQEPAVEAGIGGEFRVEAAGDATVLLDSDHFIFPAGDDVDPFADTDKFRSADEDPFTCAGTGSRLPLDLPDEGVDLATIGIAVDIHIDQFKTGWSLLRILAHQNRTGTGAQQGQ